MKQPLMTRAMHYCPWCKMRPDSPCDAHRPGWEEAKRLQRETRMGLIARIKAVAGL